MSPFDVLIVGAGPAGSVAALVLARAGVRVRLIDRAGFPRRKLCGDSLNPGALALLEQLAVGQFPTRSLPVDGMLVTGPAGARVEARYRPGVQGRIVAREDLDQWLLESAIRAGAAFQPGVRVLGASVDASVPTRITGVRAVVGEQACGLPAGLTIAADGRRSTLAFGLGLARHPRHPRRWAIGGYFEGVRGLSSLGEMHVRAGQYIGVAPLPGGLANACLVTDRAALLAAYSSAGGSGHLDAAGRLTRTLVTALAADEALGPRFSGARAVGGVTALGPLAVDADLAGMPGLLLAGDAAGFIDPMTGDGMRFAIRGGMLAAEAALDALNQGNPTPHLWLEARRRVEFGRKRAFNRTLSTLVSHSWAVRAAERAAGVCPSVIRRLVSAAGDVPPEQPCA